MKSLDKRYITTFIACCLFVLSVGLNNAYSVFVVPLADLMNVGRGTITLASTITDLICSFLSPVLIMLLRRIKLRNLLLVSTISYALILAGIGLFPNIIMYYVFNIIKGFVFVVFGCNVIIIILGNWFEKNQQTLIGIAIAFTGVGGSIFSYVFDYLITNAGMRMTFLFFGAMTLLLALPAIFLLKLKPEEAGLTILKEDNIKVEKTCLSKNRTYHFNDPVFIGLCVLFFIITFLTNISIHFPGYAGTIGLADAGASMVSFMMIGSVVFKTVMGIVCDKFGPESGFPVAILIILLSVILIIFAKEAWMLILGAFLFGCTFSILIILNPTIRYCFGDKQYPEVFSKVMMVSALSNVGGPLTGYLYDFTGSYASSLYAAVILCLIALTVYFVTMSIADRS